jgi:hypothetical protein
MAHSHSTQRFILETLNRENLSYIHYIEFHHSLYNIYNVFRYSVDTKTLIPKTRIIFSKPLKIAKSAKNRKNRPKKILGHCPECCCVTRGGIPAPPWDPLGKRLVHTWHKQNTSTRDRQTQLSYLTRPHTHTCKEYNTYPTMGLVKFTSLGEEAVRISLMIKFKSPITISFFI